MLSCMNKVTLLRLSRHLYYWISEIEVNTAFHFAPLRYILITVCSSVSC